MSDTNTDIGARIATILDLAVTAFCAHPDDVVVGYSVEAAKRSTEFGKISITLRTNPEDAPRVIGSGGRMVASLRTLLASCARNHRLVLDFTYANDNKAQENFN